MLVVEQDDTRQHVGRRRRTRFTDLGVGASMLTSALVTVVAAAPGVERAARNGLCGPVGVCTGAAGAATWLACRVASRSTAFNG